MNLRVVYYIGSANVADVAPVNVAFGNGAFAHQFAYPLLRERLYFVMINHAFEQGKKELRDGSVSV
jgi:hypothetical protein